MPKTVRLNTTQMRQWRVNQPMLAVVETGSVLRQAKPHELAALARAQKTKHRLVIREEEKDCEIITGREAICRQMLKLHGECQLRHANGIILKTVRDPEAQRYTAKETRSAPDPESCQCRDWAGRETGKHHAICEFNPQAPATERAGTQPVRRIIRQPMPADRSELSTRLGDVDRPQVREAPALPAKGIEIPSPEVCVCRSFQFPEDADKSQHHPLCEWHERWVTQDSTDHYILDLETGKPERIASFEEMKLASQALIDTGAPVITIGDKQYAVGTLQAGGEMIDKPEPETLLVLEESKPVEPPIETTAEETTTEEATAEP